MQNLTKYLLVTPGKTWPKRYIFYLIAYMGNFSYDGKNTKQPEEPLFTCPDHFGDHFNTILNIKWQQKYYRTLEILRNCPMLSNVKGALMQIWKSADIFVFTKNM